MSEPPVQNQKRNRGKHGISRVPLDRSKLRPPVTRAVQWTPQQVRFVEAWAEGNSVYASAVRAGYTDNGNYAYEMARNPKVIARYNEIKKKFEAAANMTREKVMDMLQEAYNMAKLQAEPMAMVAAAREVGKMCGYYAPVEKKIKIEGNVTLDKMNRLSDDELLQLVHGANDQITALIERSEEEDDHADDSSPLG